MREVGHEDVARVFDELTAEEERHVVSVELLATKLLARLPTEDVVRWVFPEAFGAEEAGPPVLLTPYKALSIAVRAEERAFAFWTYVAASAGSEPARALAETMAREELLHASKLRIARRGAYRAELADRQVATASSTQPLRLDELQVEAAQMAAEVVAFLCAATARLDQLGDRESVDLLRAVAGAINGSPQGVTSQTRHDIALPTGKQLQQSSAAAVLFEVEGVMERWVERYITSLDRSPDATVTAELQRLADQTMRFVAQINRRLAEIEPDLRNMVAGVAQPGQSPS